MFKSGRAGGWGVCIAVLADSVARGENGNCFRHVDKNHKIQHKKKIVIVRIIEISLLLFIQNLLFLKKLPAIILSIFLNGLCTINKIYLLMINYGKDFLK